jgi:hypothetical protein
MTLIPSDMLAIQTAIDAYEKKFPRRPSPSAEQALAWQANKSQGWKRVWAWCRVIAVQQTRSGFLAKATKLKVEGQIYGPAGIKGRVGSQT